MKYRYEVWYDCCCISEDGGFETEEEAREEAEWCVVEDRMEEWGVKREEFEVKVFEE